MRYPWFFGRGISFLPARFDEGAVPVHGNMIRSKLYALGFKDVEILDEMYLALRPEKLKDFVFKYRDLSQFVYHHNSGEFPDCDDAVSIVRGQLLMGAYLLGFKFSPCIGDITYTKATGQRHAMMAFLTHDLELKFYESQQGPSVALLPPPAVLSFDRARF